MQPPDHSIVYYCGKLQNAAQTAIPFWDASFVHGAAVSEHFRTHQRRIPLLLRHLQRLHQGLETLGIELPPSLDLAAIVTKVVDHNATLLKDTDELGICVVVSPGDVDRFAPVEVRRTDDGTPSPRILVYTYRLPTEQWATEKRHGVRLRTTSIVETSAANIPKHLKHRNRLHYYLAEQEVLAADPESRPLLLDAEGYIAESPSAGILILLDNQWIAPPHEKIFHSITIEVVSQILSDFGASFQRREFLPKELLAADEALWCSSTTGLMAVIELDGKPVGSGVPGDKLAEIELAYQRFLASQLK